MIDRDDRKWRPVNILLHRYCGIREGGIIGIDGKRIVCGVRVAGDIADNAEVARGIVEDREVDKGRNFRGEIDLV